MTWNQKRHSALTSLMEKIRVSRRHYAVCMIESAICAVKGSVQEESDDGVKLFVKIKWVICWLENDVL